MEQEKQQLLTALRAFLRQEAADVQSMSPEEWGRLWSLAAEQKVLPMAADVLLRKDDDQATVRRSAAHAMLLQFRHSARFLELYGQLLAGGTKPLVVKGLVCRSLYPKPDLRVSADEDLLVRPEEFSAVLAVLRKAGLEPEDPDAEQVVACRDRETGLYLELHRALFPEVSEAYGELNRFFDEAFEHAAETPVEGGCVWSLCSTEHWLYLILHSFKHFLHSGFGIRQVCDICLFVQAYGDQLDWSRLAEQLRETSADIFAANLLDIGREYLGFEQYPAGAEAWLESCGTLLDCDDLLEDLLSGGIYGGNSEARQHSSLITLNAMKDGSDAHSVRRVLRTVFPPGKDLARTYPYLEAHPWLLPAAWLQRIGHYQARNKTDAAKESLTIGAQRVRLLKKYRVIQ